MAGETWQKWNLTLTPYNQVGEGAAGTTFVYFNNWFLSAEQEVDSISNGGLL